ncbi:MAG: hypothetical protein H0X25_19475 [Acidobacteriales bacterium]|nr:hypothetical protein [Terriglobales bacterium]
MNTLFTSCPKVTPDTAASGEAFTNDATRAQRFDDLIALLLPVAGLASSYLAGLLLPSEIINTSWAETDLIKRNPSMAPWCG